MPTVVDIPKASPPLALPVLPPLSERQQVLLRFLWDFYQTRRYFPTHRECAEALKLRSTQVGGYLEPLIKKGYVVRLNQPSRNITLTQLAVDRLRVDIGAINQTMLPLT